MTQLTALHKPSLGAFAALTALTVALLALFAVLLDQGQLLTPVLGKTAQTMNYLHEFTHDGRHLLGAPCH